MRVIEITSTAILSLLLGIAAPAYAQQGQQGEKQDHPKQQTSKHVQAKPEQQHARQQRQSDQKQRQPQRAQQPQRQDQNKQPQRAQQRQPRIRTSSHSAPSSNGPMNNPSALRNGGRRLATASRTKLAVRPPHLAATWRLPRLSHP